MENRISIHYFVKKSNANSKGNVPIYMRITLNGKRMEFSTNRFVDPKSWKDGLGMTKGKKDDLEVLNVFLSTLKTKVYKAINKLELSVIEIAADNIRSILLGAKLYKKMALKSDYKDPKSNFYFSYIQYCFS